MFGNGTLSEHSDRVIHATSTVLINVYCSMFRPIIEFFHVVYNSMLSEEIDAQIERVQKMALKIIYGFEYKYEELLEKSGLETLKKRREKAFLKFTFNLIKNERYSAWFPLVEQSNYSLRNTKTYSKEYARTTRLFNSPLFAMRRALNEGNTESD